jgi:peptide/nickel transport system permease protein
VSDLLRLSNLTVELPTAAGWVKPVNEVSLHIGAGETLRLVGESGSGETMLSLALMGLLPAGARVTGKALFASNGTIARSLTARLQKEFQLTYLFISHSLPVVAQLAAQIAVMRAGNSWSTALLIASCINRLSLIPATC